MYSRHKQRKEQQLTNLRQLWPNTGQSADRQPISKDDDHNISPNDKRVAQSMASPVNSMSNKSPNQSSKSSLLMSRSVSRTTKRDTNSPNESSTYASPVRTTDSMAITSTIRSANKSPNVRPQSARGVGSQSRTNTHSPTTRSVGHSLAANHSKQSLSPMSRSGDNGVKHRLNSNKSPNDKSLLTATAVTTTSSPPTPPSEASISPEILFLVKAQAKSMAAINALEKKVDLLEHVIKCQNLNDVSATAHDMSSASSSSANKALNQSKDRMIVSDDSGGEYSRATTTSDEDELSLLLDQIVKRSQQLQTNSQQSVNNRFNGLSLYGHNSGQPLAQSMQMRPKPWHSCAAIPLTQATPRSPTRETLEHKLLTNNYNNRQMASQSAQPSAPPLSAPLLQSPHCQPISALLFEPNVENVLKNLDDIIANEAIDSNRFSNASTLSQTYQQRSQTSHHSSQQSFHDAITGLTAAGMANDREMETTTTSNHELERAISYVKQREDNEFNNEMRLNDEWLQTQLKTQHESNSSANTNTNTNYRRHTFIDSLEPTFR